MENIIQEAITNYDLSDIVNQSVILVLLLILFGYKLIPVRIQFKPKRHYYV